VSASGERDAERARLHELMAVGDAERIVADVRIGGEVVRALIR
jgi:hypothetical protein